MTASNTIDVKAFIDERPIARYQWLLVAPCFLVVAADGMDVAIMGFIAPSILQEWGISRPAFGIVMSAAPLGLVIGALFAGPSSDRSTLLSEYAPARKRALMITVMFTGFNLGSALIGFAAGALIPSQGWRVVLMLGGALPLALLPLLFWLLPESARLMAVQGKPAARIAATLNRVCDAHFTGGERFVSNEPPLPTRTPIGVLFAQNYGLMTVALWVTYFMGLMVIYLLTGWLPTLMKDAGLPIATSANVTAMFQIGGTIGAVIVGWAMDKVRPARVISTAYLAGGLCVLALGWIGALSPLLTLLVFSTGFCMSGAQTGLNAFAPSCYPTVARATGVSWMLGMGRFGSILGSAFGGALLGLSWGFGPILALLAVPALCAAIAIIMTQRGSAAAAVVQSGAVRA